VRLGSFELTGVPGVAPGVPLIGGEVLRRFRLFFDYANARLTFEPNPHLHDRFRAGGPQIGIRAAPVEGAVRVQDVPAGGAAARAGLVVGDLITAVDGAPVAELTFPRLQALLVRPGAAFALTVRCGNRTLAIALDNPPLAVP
jgi:C-terminal processing protease CtpA/Prc